MKEEKHARGMRWRERGRLFVHWLVGTDPEVMSGSPAIDRFQMQAKAVLLIAVAFIALFSWGSFFLLFFRWFIALPLLCPTMVWIVMVDRFMGSARWKLQGVLSAPKARAVVLSWVLVFGLIADNGTLLLRLGIGVLNASATAFSATIALNHAGIEGQEEKDRDEANAALRAAGEKETQQIRRDMLGGYETAVNDTKAAVDNLDKKIEAARGARENAAGLETNNQVNAACELYGGRGSGCLAGRGPKYRAALIRSAAANAALSRAVADLAQLEAVRSDAENKYEDALKSLRAAEPEFRQAAAAIDARVARNTVPMRNDPAMAYRALQKIYASADGEATRFYSHLMLTLLLVVELSYVLVSEYFCHATVYLPRLIARTRSLAAQAAAEYLETVKRLFGGGDDPAPPGAPAYRVLPRFGDDD